jgi:hypothetical protein
VDAARAFGTGCFKDHRTHDLRGLSEGEIHVSTRWSPPFPKIDFGGRGEEPHLLVAHLDVSDEVTHLFFGLFFF